jgi:hypothetical protein
MCGSPACIKPVIGTQFICFAGGHVFIRKFPVKEIDPATLERDAAMIKKILAELPEVAREAFASFYVDLKSEAQIEVECGIGREHFRELRRSVKAMFFDRRRTNDALACDPNTSGMFSGPREATQNIHRPI